MLLRRVPALLALALVVLVAALPDTLAAQQPAGLAGSYVYNASASDDVHAAIEAGVRSMNFITRPVARGRLRRTNVPAERIAIAFPAGSASVAFDADAPVVAPATGAPTRWTGSDGESFDLTMRHEGGRLEQSFAAEDGTRTNVYTLQPDGRTLMLEVTISSPRLPAAITYRLVYDRT